MTKIVIVIVAAGIVYAAALAVTGNLDVYGTVILAALIGAGLLSISVVRRSSRGTTAPVTCPDCGKLNSANAPYCKHCGSRAVASGDIET